MQTLTAALIVRDEAEHIESCLASVRPHVDAVVVVDTGSTDETEELARGAGARVIRQAWNDDFAEARNASLEAVETPWALIIDADERFLVQPGIELGAWLREHDEADYGWVDLFDETQDRPAQPVVRLVRVDRGLRFRYPVHEQVDVGAASGIDTPCRIIHLDTDVSNERQRYYLSLLEGLPPDDPHRLLFTLRTLITLRRWDDIEEVAKRFAALDQHGPADAQARLYAAVAANNRGQYDIAEDWARSGRARYPEFPGFHLVAMTLAARQFLGAYAAVSRPDHPLHRHIGREPHAWHEAVRAFLDSLSKD